eukprot:8199-Heterococcus_DN1.PRE.2
MSKTKTLSNRALNYAQSCYTVSVSSVTVSPRNCLSFGATGEPAVNAAISAGAVMSQVKNCCSNSSSASAHVVKYTSNGSTAVATLQYNLYTVQAASVVCAMGLRGVVDAVSTYDVVL